MRRAIRGLTHIVFCLAHGDAASGAQATVGRKMPPSTQRRLTWARLCLLLALLEVGDGMLFNGLASLSFPASRFFTCNLQFIPAVGCKSTVNPPQLSRETRETRNASARPPPPCQSDQGLRLRLLPIIPGSTDQDNFNNHAATESLRTTLLSVLSPLLFSSASFPFTTLLCIQFMYIVW